MNDEYQKQLIARTSVKCQTPKKNSNTIISLKDNLSSFQYLNKIIDFGLKFNGFNLFLQRDFINENTFFLNFDTQVCYYF